MNKLMLIAAIGLGTLLIGCNPSSEDKTWTSHGRDLETRVVEIKGHEYILMYGCYSGAITHAESCSCKK